MRLKSFFLVMQLTSQERKVVIFILCLLILGIGLDFLRKQTNSPNLANAITLQEQLFKKVDINKATLSELRTIPGLSQDIAKAIIDYRKTYGAFQNIEELKQIKGIKDKKLEQIRKYIIIEASNIKNN